MDHPTLSRLVADRPLPAALVDLDALDRNVDRLLASLGDHDCTLRVATKSVRHVGLLRRILERGGERFAGLMCYSPAEAAWLATIGFDDLLVAYPTARASALAALARRAAAGTRVTMVVDSVEHLAALEQAGAAVSTVMRAAIELDVSWRPWGQGHVGVRRSPLRTPEQVVALARHTAGLQWVQVVGLMAYEAHVAGLPDANPFAPALNAPKRWLKRLSMPDVVARRAATAAALHDDGFTLDLVNGGGTGSAAMAAAEPALTEVTAGSGFLCSHLFDYYVDLDLEPAAWFALEATRVPAPGYITCAGGGYVASGEPGWDRMPLPCIPPGLTYVKVEGAGEVQTPLKVPAGLRLRPGDPVGFRHAKAGELAERFDAYLLVRGREICASEPTYRGQGVTFL